MRSLNLIAGIFAFTGLAVSVGIGCSSSSNKGSTTTSNDGSTDSATSTEDGGDAETATCATDAGSLTSLSTAGEPDAAVAAVAMLKAACSSEFTACAADSCCNDAYITAFACLGALYVDGSVPGLMQEEPCFESILSSSDTATVALLGCITTDGAATDGAVEQ